MAHFTDPNQSYLYVEILAEYFFACGSAGNAKQAPGVRHRPLKTLRSRRLVTLFQPKFNEQKGRQ